ncbi:MAG: methyl-accepting chemotaxis protein [bacterium]|nr:methyl-accepting chemotaxis protein [bacterium]MDT8365252.1 methyl-accepting chemotaxis protein [bacterium]
MKTTGPVKKEGIGMTIGWKITSVVVIVMTVLAVVNVLFIRDRFSATMNREFESKAKAIALSIARSSEDKLISRDFTAIQSLTDTYKDVRGVNYILVQDSGGKLTAGTFKRGFSENLLGLNPITGEEEYKIARFEIEEVGDVLEVAVPILFGRAGAVRVGMDYGHIVSELNQITKNLVIQCAIASILGIILLHLVVIYLLRHMNTFINVLVRVGAGDLTARVNVTSRDEFLDLATHLNSTLAQLGVIIERVDLSYESISQANVNIAQVYTDVQEGIEQQVGLASETMESVMSSKKMTDEVTGGIHVLENSSNDSFSNVMEMGASIEEVSSMSDSLFNSVNESNTAIEELSNSIEQISKNLASLSGAAEETAGAMNEMSASIVQVRGTAESTAQDAVQMTQVAEKGMEVSKNAREGMGAIKKSSAQVSQTISLVSDRIEEIDEILRFITEITGKTNLLALNAAIIAAQAGAQGKGFGVVADEINELAQSTKAQTNRIGEVIDGLREEVVRASEAVEDSNQKVDEGVNLTEEVTKALKSIMDNTLLVSHRIEEIAQTTSEQASTSNRVLETTQNLTESVGNIKALSEQQSEAGEKLLQMSRQIQQAAEKVKTSTEEQTLTSQQINKDLTRITDTVRNISESTEIQVVNGAKVLRLTENLTSVIQRNKETVHGLQGVIDDLHQRMEALHHDLEIFKTGKDA